MLLNHFNHKNPPNREAAPKVIFVQIAEMNATSVNVTRPDDRRGALVALWPQSRSDLSRCVFAALGKICNWEAAGNPIVEFRRAETHYGLNG